MSEPVYQRLAPATEIAENSMRAYALGERSILVCRTKAGGKALTVLSLDSEPPQAVLDELKKDHDISNVKVVKL